MSKPRVFISHYMPQVGVDMIREHCEIDYYSGTEPLSKNEFIARASQADAVLAFVCDYIDEDIVSQCPRVQVISSFGKGSDNIDVDACTRHNVLVTINPDALTESTADLALGLLLSVSRNILNGDRHVRDRQFHGWHAIHCLGKDFHHSKLGIIGFGVIGQAIARRAKGFDTEISYYDVVRKSDEAEKLGASYADMPLLLAESDFVIIAVDLRADNVHLVREEHLRLMKPGSYLVNISRGSIVDEAAVTRALQQGWIQGYAADVFEFEDRIVTDRPKYIDSGLLDRPEQTVLTPHIGTGTQQARERLAISSATQLLQALSGELSSGAVNGLRLAPLIRRQHE
jgi:lactate dehydrogenase-like 2-hydroxyacid dehydrogenase